MIVIKNGYFIRSLNMVTIMKYEPALVAAPPKALTPLFPRQAVSSFQYPLLGLAMIPYTRRARFDIRGRG